MYEVTKRFLDTGSTCFRNHRATSHCRVLHGHNLTFDVTFASPVLDHRGWVVDFGGLKTLRGALEEQFDHTTVVAADDPYLNDFKSLDEEGVIDLRIIETISCESFARWAFEAAELVLGSLPEGAGPVFVLKVTCHEDGKNSATYVRT